MKKTFLIYCISITHLFLCINASELECFYSIDLPQIKNKNDAEKVLQKLVNPFTREERKKAVKDLLTGDPFLDKGMFQLHMYEQYIEKSSSLIKKEKIYDYFLYRISKYMVQTIIALLKCDTKNYDYTKNKNLMFTIAINHIGILHSWQLLYQDIQWFSQENNKKLLTPLTLFNYSFISAFLLDYIRKNRIEYEMRKDYAFLTVLKKHVFSEIGTTYIQNNINTFNKNPCSLFIAYKNDFTIDEIKKWSTNVEQFLVPIIVKNSEIGLIPLILCMIKKYCVVGIGYEEIYLHGERYNDITGAIVHDTLHYILQMADLKHTPDKLKLFNNVYAVIQKAVKIYSSTHNASKKLVMLKCFLSLFMITHELTSTFEDSDDIQKNPTITDKLKEFLCLPDNITFRSSVQKEDYKKEDIFFYLSDIFLIYQRAYPKLLNVLNQNCIKIEHGNFVTANEKKMYYGQVMSIRHNLIYCIADAWSVLLKTYGKELGPLFFCS